MRRRFIAVVPAAALVVAVVLAGQVRPDAAATYLTPPKVIVDILDAPPLPSVAVSPTRETVALLERRSMPSIKELAQPMLRLAGYRINPKTSGAQRPGAIFGITLQTIRTGARTKVAVPADAAIGSVSFSPDGSKLAFTNTTDTGIELWIGLGEDTLGPAEAADRGSRRASGRAGAAARTTPMYRRGVPTSRRRPSPRCRTART